MGTFLLSVPGDTSNERQHTDSLGVTHWAETGAGSGAKRRSKPHSRTEPETPAEIAQTRARRADQPRLAGAPRRNRYASLILAICRFANLCRS